VIVGDLFATYHAGTGYLYTVEHFRVVEERLNEGGVFVQFFQTDEITYRELRIVVATFLDVFGEVDLWVNRTTRLTPSLALVGRGKDLRPDAMLDFEPERVTEIRPGEFARLCTTAPLRRWAEGARLNTDHYPVVEFLAAASYLEKRPGDIRAMLDTLRNRCAEFGPTGRAGE